ncbi:hypothetical protein, partial [Bacillus amyloliquefaciens]|uniref:hypothetical protein n=1 Tax=Bacillus amyloliquefaciens TaxID=1390 RepID=UPI001F18374B
RHQHSASFYAFISLQNEHVSALTELPSLLYVPHSGHAGLASTRTENNMQWHLLYRRYTGSRVQ